MPLVLSHTTTHGVVASSAYHVITRYDVDATRSNLTTCDVSVYLDKSKYLAGNDPLERYSFSFTYTEGKADAKLTAQAEAFLLTQDTVTDKFGRTQSINYKGASQG